MKKLGIVLIISILFGIQTAYTQNTEVKSKEQKKIEKQKAKEEAKKLEETQWYALKTQIEEKNIVFRGTILSGSNGTITLDPKINFVIIDGDNAVIQIATGFGGGYNGIGGITIEGSIDNYKVSAKKTGKAINVDITIKPKLGQGAAGGPINISINAFSFDSARLTFGGKPGVMQGEIVDPVGAKIFVGNTPN